VYYETIRTFYEAFVIAAFFALLTQFVGDASEERKERLREKGEMSYPFPFGCITYEPKSTSHLFFIKWGVLQYVVINPLITVAALVTETLGVYCAESMSFHFARVYLSIVEFFSVTIAMYALITFYITIKTEIEDEKPLYKFACVKLDVYHEVVFITKYVWYLLSGKKLPDSTSRALNIYGAIHANDRTTYTPLKDMYHYELHEQTPLDIKLDEDAEENAGKVEENAGNMEEKGEKRS
ncbi:7979_t:CDS:2, partial [Acaulospora colombiana]